MNKKDRDKKGMLKWQLIDIENENTTASIKFCRAKVPTGWLLRAVWDEGMTMTFISDMHHAWVV